MKNVSVQYANEQTHVYTPASPGNNSAFRRTKNSFKKISACCFILLSCFLTSPFLVFGQCTTGCNQATTGNSMPGTNNFSNTFCITTASTLTYNQNFDMNGGTTCVGPNVTFSSGGGNWNGNWTVNNYGSFSKGITLNSGQTFNNYGTFTGSVSLNGGSIVNYNGATFTPSSFNFNGGSFTNNPGGTATFGSSVTVNSGATFINNGTLTTTGLTLNSSATATLGGNTTINGSVTNNGTVNISGLITVTGNYNQNSSGTMASITGSQCNALNVTGSIQGQGTYNGSNGLLLNKVLSSPACTTCLTNGASTTPPGQPANQITGAVLTATGNTISGTVTNPGGSPAATSYIVLRRFGTAVSDQPVNYVNYTAGTVIGNSVVVAVNAISTLTFTDLNVITTYGCGTYYYAVFPYNAAGSCGTYNSTINASNRSSIAVTSTGGTVGTSAAVCSGSTSGVLTLPVYVGSILRWESSVSPFSTWSTISNSSNTYTSGTLTQTTRFRAVVNAGTGCSDANASAATITVNSNPSAPTGTGATRCGNGSLTVTATPGAGETIDWYAAASGGTALLTGNTAYTTSSLSSTTTYYAVARNTSSGCVSLTRTAVTATVNPSPSVTLSAFPGICSGTTTTSLTYSGALNSPDQYSIDWSSAANAAGMTDVSWTTLSGGTIPVTGLTSTAGAYAATVLVRNSSTGCQKDVSNGAVVTCGTAAENTALTLTAPASGVFTAINFASYGTATGSCGSFSTSACHSSTSLTVVQAAALGNNSFTLTAGNGIFGDPCVGTVKSLTIEAASTAQVLNIYAIPGVVSSSGASRCQTGSVTVSATASAGATIDWYAAATGGTALATASSSYTTSLSATTTFYAEARNTTAGCLSASRTAVTASINAIPVAPSVTNNSRCGNGTVTLTATPGPGETIDWYAAATGGTALATGSSTYNTGTISSTTTYYAESRNIASGCISATRTAITATVNPSPSVTLSGFTAVCSGTTSTTLTYTSPVNSPDQYSIDWGSAANAAGMADVGWTSLAAGTIPVTGLTGTAGNYAANIYVRNSLTGCQTDVSNGAAVTCGTVAENVSLTLTAPGSGVFSTINFASYGTPTGSCGSFATSSCHSLTSLTVVQNAALGNNSFTLTANNATFGDPCSGTVKRLYVEAVSSIQVLTINALPTVTASSGATRCGTGTVTISATPSGGAAIDWYATSTGGTALETASNSFTTPSISTTTSYYAQAGNTTTGCISAARTMVTATVTVPAISSFTPVNAGPGMSVIITGTNFTSASAVNFGGTAASSYTVNSATQITAVIGTGTTGSIAVTTPCGTATKAGFTYYPLPTITTFTPASGYIGNTITITGTNFTGTTVVSFGGTAAASFTVISPTTITAVLNTGTSGSVSVTTPGGTATKTGFTYIQATIWAGTFNNSWSTGGNWNNGVPTAVSLVVIPPVETYPTLAANQTVGALSMDTNTVLNISGANTLTITGNITNNGTVNGTGKITMAGSSAQTISGSGTVNNIAINNNAGVAIGSGSNMLNITGSLTPTAGTLTTNGKLTLKSSAAGTAMIAQGSSAGSYISGTVIFERYIPARRAWRLISYPFSSSGAPTINASIQEAAGGTAGSNPYPGYGTHITGGISVNGFDQSPTNNASMKELSGSSWVGINSTNQPISSKPGYFIFVRGSRANNLSQGTGAASDNTTLRGIGNIRQGNQSLTINGSGWQLMGNPFPSPIDLHAVATTNSAVINNNFKFWDPKLGGSNNVGGYVTASYNGSSYDYAPAPASSISEFVQSGAAFFVDAKVPGTLAVNEAHKAAGGSDNVFRPGAVQSKLHVNLRSVNNDATQPVVDGVMIGYDEDFDNNIDEYDAGKLPINTNENLAVKRAGKLLSIERRKSFTTTDTIYLNLNYLKVKSYQLELNAAAFDAGTLTASLEDAEAGSITQLDLTGTTVYDFSINNSSNLNRFKIVFKKNNLVVLPVTVTSITAVKQEGAIKVEWKVQNEINLAGYEVERSADGIHFIKLADKNAGNSNNATYQWSDVNPLNGISYYRIRIIERDGQAKYSAVVHVVTDNQVPISIYPNPIVNNTVQLLMTGQPGGKYLMNIYTSNGQNISSNEFDFNGTAAVKPITISTVLPKGIYHTEINGPAGIKTVIPFSVQ